MLNNFKKILILKFLALLLFSIKSKTLIIRLRNFQKHRNINPSTTNPVSRTLSNQFEPDKFLFRSSENIHGNLSASNHGYRKLSHLVKKLKTLSGSAERSHGKIYLSHYL